MSLQGCTYFIRIINNVNLMKSIQTLDLHNCLNLRKFPLGKAAMCRESLIFLDLGFCNLSTWCYWRVKLFNIFVSLPDTFSRLSRWPSSLAYLNLSQCNDLKYLPALPQASAPSVGRYFKTESGSRNHISGLYIFHCNNLEYYTPEGKSLFQVALDWLIRLVEVCYEHKSLGEPHPKS